MNGQIAQLLSMTSFAKADLASKESISYSLDNPTAVYCKQILFMDWLKKGGISSFFGGKQKYTARPIAENYGQWISFLKQEGIKGLFLHYFPDEKSPFSDKIASEIPEGSGRWQLEAWKGEYSDYWEPRWRVSEKDGVDKRIWTVAYARTSIIGLAQKEKHSGLEGIQSVLTDALEACLSFSEKHSLEKWQSCFTKALKYLKTGETALLPMDQNALIPVEKYSEEAKRILFTAQATWVFGGEGSWNDMRFEGNEQVLYKQISDKLYSILCKAVVHAVNEYDH